MEQAELFGKYQLVRPLATGGMAEVFLASQLGPGGVTREVVVKRVLPQLSAASDFVDMFLDEARVAARLSHPNVVQVFDFGQENGSYFLVLEYLDGADIDTILRLAQQRHQPMPERIAALIAAQALDGLQYVHSLAGPDGRPLHVIHRDVSPSNLFVTYQGTVKLLDFGIAKAESNLSTTQAGMTKGKIAYMAPEQLLHEPLDPRSDVFALGIVFYELLAGLGLFHRADSGAMMRAVLTEPIPPPSTLRPGLSPQLEAVAMRALSRNPDERYASAAEMRAELDKFLAAQPFVPAADALQGYLKELVQLEPSGKLPAHSPQAVRTDQVMGLERPVPTSHPGFAEEFEPTAAVTDPAGLAQGTLPPAWQRWLPAVASLPLVLLIGFGIRHWPSAHHEARDTPPAKPTLATHHRAVSERSVEKSAAVGSLEVSCIPACRVFIDGEEAGQSPLSPISLAPGRHVVKAIDLHNGKERTSSVTVKAGKQVVHTVRF
jgi:serine/threonine-protein kinase